MPIELELISQENKECLMQKTLEILNCPLDNDPLLDAWMDVFRILVVQLDIDHIVSEVLPEAFPLF